MQQEEAFTQIVKKHEGLIYKITRIYTSNEDDQKDLYQEIVYQLWKSYDTFRGEAKISTWMYRVALNTALTHLNKEKKRGHRVTIDGLVLQQDSYDPILEERLKVLYKHIKSLSALEKGLILLFLEGKKYEEIAAISGFTTTNVGTRISRIKEKLRTQIVNK